jgi:hypothetical protein
LIVLSDIKPNLAHSWLGQESVHQLHKVGKKKEKKKVLERFYISITICQTFLGMITHDTTSKFLKIKILGQEIKEDNKNSWAHQLGAPFLFPIL